MNITIIIATHKRGQILSKTLESFKGLDVEGISWEILLVDNAGEKNVEEMVQKYQKDLPIQYFIHNTHKGKNFALNFAIEKTQGDLIVLTDDDVIVDKNWLKELYTGSQRWSDYSVFGGKIVPLWPNNTDVDFIKGTLSEGFFNAAFAVADWDIDEGPYLAGQVWGPNMAIRKSVFDQGFRFNVGVGPSGKTYIMGSETEFTKRLERNGFKSIYLPKSFVHHQIRKEQVEKQWLCKRAYNYGRTHVFYEKAEEVTKFFGVPRYMIFIYVKYCLKQFISYLTFNKSQNLRWAKKCAFIRGQLYQYKQPVITIDEKSSDRNLTKGALPKVSVIIPTYNRAHMVKDTIDSVLNQTYKNVEIIIIDDGSLDNTLDVLKVYNDKIKVLKQENKGNSAARNKGLLYATGEYVAFLDDDDQWMETKLETEVQYLEQNSSLAFVYVAVDLFDNANKIVGVRKKYSDEDCSFDRLYQNCTIISPSAALIRRANLDAIGNFDERLTQSSDYDLWLRLARKYPFGYIDEILARYRIHEGNISRNLDNRLVNFKRIFKKPSIRGDKIWIEKYIKISHAYYYIATLCYQNKNYLSAARYYFGAIVRYPFIGIFYWPKEIQNLKFTFLYRIAKVYFLVIKCLIKSVVSRA
jgi:glycosyltransferase involved in cell wall biosynthesis